MDITAPYNFVPLSKSIFLPPWGGALAYDLPFRRGLSGKLDYVITAHTPLLVSSGRIEGGDDHTPELCRFFQVPSQEDPERRYAIPGSSVRGMTRNVLEIASFARMRLVDNRRYGLRDLTPAARTDYRDRMTEPKSDAYSPKVRAGWLHFYEGRWVIDEVEFARLDHAELMRLTSEPFQVAFAAIKDSHSQADRECPKIYAAWDKHVGLRKLDQVVDVQRRPQAHRHSRNQLYYRRALAQAEGSPPPGYMPVNGTLVFTGLPSPKKHMEFFFFEPDVAAERQIVPEGVWQGFIDVHEKGENPSATWQFWLQRYRSGAAAAIPVFFLLDGKEVESLGLAMMYKKAHKHTVHGLVCHTNRDHVNPAPGEAADLVELIFGRVGDTPADTLKGRVSFGLAMLEGDQSRVQESRHTVVFSSPKPSYFASYVRQTDLKHDDGLELYWETKQRNGRAFTDRAEYKSYMDDDAEIRGWKRYHARGRANPTEAGPPPDTSLRSHTVIQPIRSADEARPLTFRGTMRFHNLLPEELGALVWALTWGGDTKLRHGLGMGKSVGLGNVAVAIDGVEIIPNDADAKTPTLDECSAAYQIVMDAWSKSRHGPGISWCETPQLKALLAMANPELTPAVVRHMKIEPANDFVKAKKDGLVLREPPGLFPPFRQTDRRKMKPWRQAKRSL